MAIDQLTDESKVYQEAKLFDVELTLDKKAKGKIDGYQTKDERLRLALLDPALFAKVFLNMDLWQTQADILRALVTEPRVAVKSCHSSGKTRAVGVAVLWYLARYKEAVIVTTAPTYNQVERVLWGEIHSIFENSILSSANIWPKKQVLNMSIELGAKRYAYGMSTSVTRQDEGVKFQGIHACLSEDHEILTKRGWVGIDSIQNTDVVLSVPMNGKFAEWMPVTAVHKYSFDGELVVYDGRKISFAVTDKHKFLYKYDNHDTKPWKFDTAFNLSKRYQWAIRRTSSWKGSELVIPEPFKKFGWTPARFAEIIGFWIGDGGTREFSPGIFYEMIFYQIKDDGGYLENLLFGLRLSKYADYYSLCDRACTQWLIENVGRYSVKRKIPREIMDSTPEILESFCRGLWHADGNVDFNSGQLGMLYSSNAVLMDQVQEILIKLERPAVVHTYLKAGEKSIAPQGEVNVNYDCMEIGYNKTKGIDHVIISKNLKREKYKGKVWCVSTPYETFYTRRKGKVILSGNSNVLIIMDEAPGVHPKIWEAIEGARAGGNVRVLAIGNPTMASGPFHDAFTDNRSGWKTFSISAFDTPNFDGLGDTHEKKLETLLSLPQDELDKNICPYLTTRRWVKEKYFEYGPGHFLWESRVLGEFPKQNEDALISLSWLEEAKNREMDEKGAKWLAKESDKVVAGLDVAGPGEAETSLTIRKGPQILVHKQWPIQDPRGEVVRELLPYKGQLQAVNVDAVAIGWYIYKHLLDMKFPAVPIIVQTPSNDNEKYADLKAQFYWNLRMRLASGEFSGLDDEKTIGQLAGIRYKPNSRGQIEIESKAKASERGAKSPDRAESIMLAFAEQGIGQLGVLEWSKSEKLVEEQQRLASLGLIKDEKPVISCPKCQAVCIAPCNGGLRCNSCGYQWFEKPIVQQKMPTRDESIYTNKRLTQNVRFRN